MNKKIKTVIIDDEKAFINTLEIMLRPQEDFEIVGNARSVKEGIELIGKTNPDLVFLDVELGDGKGFDLLRSTKNFQFNVVFVTAYDHYAVEAFRFSAIDYLLKPIESSELFHALQKVKENLTKEKLQLRIDTLLENMGSHEKKKILLNELDTQYVIEIDQILWCQAEGSYTRFFLKNEKRIMVSKHLKEYENLLSPYQFYRIHRSHLVNMNKIIKFEKQNGGTVFLEGGHQLAVSFRKKDKLSNLLATM